MAERDDKGRFIKGHRGGPGRPPREREERYYDILVTTVTFEDWKAIVKKAADQAKRGNAVARKWLSDYLVGAVQQRLDVTSDGDKITVRLIGDDDS